MVADKFVPKMERIEPGDKETGPGAKLAPLTMPADGTCAVPKENNENLALNEVPATVAITVTGPVAAPSVTPVDAFPCPSVNAPAGLSEASLSVTANSMRAPANGI